MHTLKTHVSTCIQRQYDSWDFEDFETESRQYMIFGHDRREPWGGVGGSLLGLLALGVSNVSLDMLFATKDLV